MASLIIGSTLFSLGVFFFINPTRQMEELLSSIIYSNAILEYLLIRGLLLTNLVIIFEFLYFEDR